MCVSHSLRMRSTLLTIDAIGAAVVGLVLFFYPRTVTDFLLERKSDGVHWHLVRCVGGQIFAGGFISFRLRNAGPTAHTMCYMLRIILSVICLMLVYQCRAMTPNLIGSSHLEIAKSFLFFSLVFNAMLLVSSGWKIGAALLNDNRVGDCLYQLDALASICIGTAWLTFPKWLLHKQVVIMLDESHELFGRVMGALFVSSYVVATHALYWINECDRMIAVDSRIVSVSPKVSLLWTYTSTMPPAVSRAFTEQLYRCPQSPQCCLCILSAQVWSQIAYLDSWSKAHWVGICLFSAWTAIAIVYRVALCYTQRKAKKSI